MLQRIEMLRMLKLNTADVNIATMQMQSEMTMKMPMLETNQVSSARLPSWTY